MMTTVRMATRTDFGGLLENEYIGVFHGVGPTSEKGNPHKILNRMLARGTCQVRTFEPGQEILAEGHLSPSLYIVLPNTGSVVSREHRIAGSGITRVSGFDTIGLLGGGMEDFTRDVTDANPNPNKGGRNFETFRALTKTSLIEIHGPAREIMLGNISIVWNLTRLLAIRSIEQDTYDEVAKADGPKGMVKLLLKKITAGPEHGGLGLRPGAGDDGFQVINQPISQAELARALRVTNVTVGTIFRELESEGLAKYSRGGEICINPTSIAKYPDEGLGRRNRRVLKEQRPVAAQIGAKRGPGRPRSNPNPS